jgi:prevent-host-death family protein
MESISVSELRRHTPHYVDMAKSGARVPITVRGELVAYLVPPGAVPGLNQATITPAQSSPAAAPNAAE